MRVLLIVLITGVIFAAGTANAQTRTFTQGDLEYVLEFPSPAWQAISRLDVHDHLEFIFEGNPANGDLSLRKRLVDTGTTSADLFQFDEKWEFERLPGYVACSSCQGESFAGRLSGAVFSYEYVSGGRIMAGRIYYLQIDKRAFYSLRFTGARDKLKPMLEDMNFIARSFRLK